MHDQVPLTPRGLDQRAVTLIDGGHPRLGGSPAAVIPGTVGGCSRTSRVLSHRFHTSLSQGSTVDPMSAAVGSKPPSGSLGPLL
jgi:hypothetical protein